MAKKKSKRRGERVFRSKPVSETRTKRAAVAARLVDLASIEPDSFKWAGAPAKSHVLTGSRVRFTGAEVTSRG